MPPCATCCRRKVIVLSVQPRAVLQHHHTKNPSTEAQQIFFGAELRQVTSLRLEVVLPAAPCRARLLRKDIFCRLPGNSHHRLGAADDIPSKIIGHLDAVNAFELRCHLRFLHDNLTKGEGIIINAIGGIPNTPTPDQQPCSPAVRCFVSATRQKLPEAHASPLTTLNCDIATLRQADPPILTWTAPPSAAIPA